MNPNSIMQDLGKSSYNFSCKIDLKILIFKKN